MYEMGVEGGADVIVDWSGLEIVLDLFGGDTSAKTGRFSESDIKVQGQVYVSSGFVVKARVKVCVRARAHVCTCNTRACDRHITTTTDLDLLASSPPVRAAPHIFAQVAPSLCFFSLICVGVAAEGFFEASAGSDHAVTTTAGAGTNLSPDGCTE